MLSNIIPIVLCAGLGTRLKPLTNHIPKAVIPLGNFPLVFYAIKELLELGFNEIHINTHYLENVLKNEIWNALDKHNYPKTCVRFWSENPILETGGGIIRIAQKIMQEKKRFYDFLVISGDIYGKVNWHQILSYWRNKTSNDFALMISRDLSYDRPDVIWVNQEETQVIGFHSDYLKNDKLVKPRLFSTYQIINGDYLSTLSISIGTSVKLIYKTGLSLGRQIINYNYAPDQYWYDAGTYIDYAICLKEQCLIKNNLPKQCLGLFFKTKKEPKACAQSLEFLSLISSYGNKSNDSTNQSNWLERFEQDLQPVLEIINLNSFLPNAIFAGGLSTELFLNSSLSWNTHIQQLLSFCLNHYLSLDSSSLAQGALNPAREALPNQPILIFSLTNQGTRNQLPYPLLLPLELITATTSTCNTNLITNHYFNSQTFFLLL